MPEYTIRDIAKMVGVSTGTVSRVLNNADNIDPDLVQRTLEIIRNTNYKPGNRGRRPGLRRQVDQKQMNNTIAVISPEMTPEWKTNELWSSFMSGIERACRERGFHLVVYMAGKYGSEQEMVDDISGRAAGILLKMVIAVPEYIKMLAKKKPVIGFGGYNPMIQLPQVALDNHAAGMIVADRLIKMGHRRIAFINPECHHHMFVSRSHGYMEMMKREGIFDPELLIEYGETIQPKPIEPATTPPDMTDILDRLLQIPNRPTAAIFANDWTALGFYKACAARHIRIPDDFSVVGFDDVGTLCEVLTPALSSVAMPFDRVAYFAACNLFDMIEGVGLYRRNLASVQYLPGEFKLRGSIKSLI